MIRRTKKAHPRAQLNKPMANKPPPIKCVRCGGPYSSYGHTCEAAKEQAKRPLDGATCSALVDARKYAEPHGSKERVEEQLRIALDGHTESELWGEYGLIAATMRCVAAIEQLDAALVARIKKWADWKQNPEARLNGCEPKWFEGWITGKIEELQNVREMLLCLQSGKSMAWAIPSENAGLSHGDESASPTTR
jgi:hypothetical protein